MRIVLSGLWFPVGVQAYLLRAARRRKDLEVITVGPTSGPGIAWGPEFSFPKYAVMPDVPVGDLPLPDRQVFASPRESVEEVKRRGGCDLWIDVDGAYFTDAPMPYPHAIVGTDPHIGDISPSWRYERQRAIADFFFCMQSPYCEVTLKGGGCPGCTSTPATASRKDIWLPYAYDPCFYPEDLPYQADVTVLGAPYPKRRAVAEELARRGLKVFIYETGFGTLFDEHRRDLCAAPVAFLWSVRDDLICRVFEAAACGRAIVTNEVPDLERYLPGPTKSSFRVDWERESHGYRAPARDIQAAADAVECLFTRSGRSWIPRQPLVKELQKRALDAIQGETWDARLQSILDICLG